MTFYRTYFFETVLQDDAYNPDGYIEKQDDKTTYFVWRRVLKGG